MLICWWPWLAGFVCVCISFVAIFAMDLAQEPVAKVLLPERLWFSEAIVMTSGFEQPEAISPRLTWSKDQLVVELAFPSKWTQEFMAENHISQCQVRFQNALNGEIFCSEASQVSALYHVDRRSSCLLYTI